MPVNVQIRMNIYPRTIADAFVTSFLFGIIPSVYYFELWIVLPSFYQIWGPAYMFHFCMGNFILFNICSNLLSVMFTDTSTHGIILPADGGKNWKFCTVCEVLVPPRSWHCSVCDLCILKRDHHCMFTSCCIGHRNHRYFLLFVFYMFVATFYSSVFNFQWVIEFVTFDSWLSIVKVVFPFATLFLEWTENQVHLIMAIIALFGCMFTGALLCYHLVLIFRGRLTHEKPDKIGMYDYGKLNNLKVVLGERWYFTWISPFIKSKLPCDGIHWVVKNAAKTK